MRLLFVIASMPVGGLEIFTVNLANEMAAKGHDVSILIFRDKAKCVNLIKDKNVRIVSAGRNLRYDPVFLARIALFLKGARPQVILSLSEFAYFVTEKMVFIGKSQKFSIRSDFYQQTRNWKSTKCFAVLR